MLTSFPKSTTVIDGDVAVFLRCFKTVVREENKPKLWEIRTDRRGGENRARGDGQGGLLLYYCSVYRATWLPTSTRRRSTWRRRWLQRSRRATPVVCQWSPAGSTLCPGRRLHGRAVPGPCRTCRVSGRATRRVSSPCRRKASVERLDAAARTSSRGQRLDLSIASS